MEASARMRYASVLFQETENYAEAEEILSKGVRSMPTPAGVWTTNMSIGLTLRAS